MKTPVFEANAAAQSILGFLDHDDGLTRDRCFKTAVQIGMEVHTVTFCWDVIGVSRDSRGCYYCCVLTTTDSAKLNRVKGFTWFAEEYGQFFLAEGMGKVE